MRSSALRTVSSFVGCMIARTSFTLQVRYTEAVFAQSLRGPTLAYRTCDEYPKSLVRHIEFLHPRLDEGSADFAQKTRDLIRQGIKTMRNCLLFAVWLITTSICLGQSPSPAALRIERLLESEFKAGNFNGVVLAAEQGTIGYHGAFGVTDLTGRAKLGKKSVFRLASVSKAFTGMAITMLRDEGKLSIDDGVKLHIPEFPYAGITIRNLLHHTSGLPDYVELLEEHWDIENKDSSTRTIARSPDALALLIKHRPKVRFAPGEKYEYSNTGYITLGLIVERIAKKPFEQFLADRIFSPLKMQDTVLFNPLSPPKITRRAFGFRESGDGREANDEHFLNGMYGDGEVYSTAEDLLRWDQALYGDDNLVAKKSIQEIFTSGQLNDGSPTNYGYGWTVHEKYGHRVVSHGGAWIGFRTWIERDLDTKRLLVILTNNTTDQLGRLKAKLQPIVFESPCLLPAAE